MFKALVSGKFKQLVSPTIGLATFNKAIEQFFTQAHGCSRKATGATHNPV